MLNVTEIDVRKVDPEAAYQKRGYEAWRAALKDLGRDGRVHVFTKGESILENLQNRRQRPHTVYKKEVIPAVLAAMGLPADTKVRWSQKAGCTCGCSPGFIVDAVRGVTAYVTVEATE